MCRGCVTPKQIDSLKTAVEDDVSMLDGYEELPDDLQEKVKLALENGHVADEDWRGVTASAFHHRGRFVLIVLGSRAKSSW